MTQLPSQARRVKMVVFDFDGVFTDNYVWVDEKGREILRFCRADGIGLERLRAAGIEALVLSSEINPLVSRRCRKLKVPCVQGVPDKLKRLEQILKKRRIGFDRIAYVGNDINDYDCLCRAGLPIVVADAHSSVKNLAKYRTRQKGGRGAVREICEMILEAGKAI